MNIFKIMQAIMQQCIDMNPNCTRKIEDKYKYGIKPPTGAEYILFGICGPHGISINDHTFDYYSPHFFEKIETFLHNNGIITDFNKLEL